MRADVVVLDASAAVNLVAVTERAAGVAAALQGATLAVPATFDAEVVSALAGLQRGRRITLDRADAACGRLASLPAQRVALQPLLKAAWDLRHQVSTYDAFYVALARSLAAPLVSTDARLARAGVPGVELVLVS